MKKLSRLGNGKDRRSFVCFTGKGLPRPLPVCFTDEKTEWSKLLKRLYCKLYIHEWKKQFNDWTVLDGEQWELEIRLTGRRVRKYSGSNAFPPYWNELLRTFKPYYGEKHSTIMNRMNDSEM